MYLKSSSDDFLEEPDTALKDSVTRWQFLMAESFSMPDMSRGLSQADKAIVRIKQEVVIHRLKLFCGTADIF